MSNPVRFLTASVLAAAFFAAPGPEVLHAAEIKVLSGNGAKAAVKELTSQFEQASGHKISLGSK